MGFQEMSGAGGLFFCGLAIGGAWMAAVVSPNCSFDKLTGARADTHVRELLYRALLPVGLMMLVSAGLFLISGSWAAAIASALSAFGFLATRLMLAPKKGRNPRGVPTRRRDQRAISVLLCLMFMLSSLVAVLLGLSGL